MNAWLVRLSATENGSFFWDESCQELKCWKPALSSRQFYVPLALFQPHNRAPRISYLSASHVMQSCRHTKRGSAQLVIEGKKLANAFSFSVDFAPHLDPHLQRCIVAIVLSSVATVCQISSLVMRPLRHCGKKLLIVRTLSISFWQLLTALIAPRSCSCFLDTVPIRTGLGPASFFSAF